MAQLHDCLKTAVNGGELDADRADAAATEFDQLVERYVQAMPLHQAEALAMTHLKEATRRAQRSRKHAVINQLQSLVRLDHVVKSADSPEKSILALLEPRADDGFRGESVRFTTEALQSRIRADLKQFLAETGQNITGRSRDVAKLIDVIRELHGQKTDSPIARTHADAIRKVQTWLRQMFNAHGGDIGEIADYGLRHSHDASSIRRAGFEAWASEIAPLLDWHRIIDRTTEQPFAGSGLQPSPEAADRFLREVYDNITTEGWHRRDATLGMGGRALYNQRSEARILHFRDGDAWLNYNSHFGQSDPFSSLVGGLDAMARDIGLMKILGPNPNLGLDYAIQVAEKAASTSGDEARIALARQNGRKARVMLQHLNGAINVPERELFARTMANVRHFNIATKLGSALLSAVTDLTTVSVGAAVSGQNPANLLARGVDLMARQASRAEAGRAGFVAETLMSIGTSSARLTNDVVANDVFSRMSGFTIRASGLAYWTDHLRVAVQMETAGHLAQNAARPLSEVDDGLQRVLVRNGITAGDWDALRAGPLFEPRPGASFLSPHWWLEHQELLPRHEAESLAARLQGAFQEHLETLVPVRRIRGLASLLGESRPGTAGGELLRSTAGFKNYAISLTIGQIAAFNSLPSPMSKVAYLSSMAAGMMVLGALSLQFKELSKGRDPRPMQDPAFWLAAAAQSGGLGIFGDFAFSETNRFGGGFATTLAGPVAGLVSDVANPIMSNLNRVAEGEKPLLGRDVANLVRHNTPVGSSLWYTRLVFDRYVADNLQRLLDPDAERQWRIAEKRVARDFGTESWFHRGSTLPDRSPDFGNAFEASP